MIKIKTISCCFCMLICSIFLFAGCSNATQYSVYYLDGSRSTEYQIKVDNTACTSLGLDPDKIIEKIDYYATQQENYMRKLGKNFEGVKIQHGIDSTSNYTYNFAVSFETFEAYCNFYGITQEKLDNIQPEIESNLFVSRYIIQRYSLIDDSGKLKPSMLGIYSEYSTIYEDFRRNICNNNATLCDQMLDKIHLNIVLCFPQSKGYRSNANQVGVVKLPEGVGTQSTTYYSAHYWSGTILNPPKEILVYRNYVLANNRVAWYLTAVIISLIFGAILFVILYNKHKKQQSRITPLFDENSSQGDNPENPNAPTPPKIEAFLAKPDLMTIMRLDNAQQNQPPQENKDTSQENSTPTEKNKKNDEK